jgi:cysteine desulfurase/selenocysteine lyase
MMLDVQAQASLAPRGDFPILAQTVHGKPLVYLDSTATAQKPNAVLDAMDRYYRATNANVHRGAYALSEEASAQYEDARKRIARFIHARSVREVIFTRNATEGLNLVAQTRGRSHHPDRDGAPQQSGAVADPRGARGGNARLHPCAG